MKVLVLPEDRFTDLLRAAYNEGLTESALDDAKRSAVVTRLAREAGDLSEASGLQLATPEELRERKAKAQPSDGGSVHQKGQ